MDGRLAAAGGGGAHLDTVRALHQTVVSLRTALEVSKNELKELKEKYEQHSHCLEYADVIEKLTLENHILRRRIIDGGVEEPTAQNIKLQVTYSPRQDVEEFSEVVINTATTEVHSVVGSIDKEVRTFCSTDRLNEIKEKSESLEDKYSAERTSKSESPRDYTVNPDTSSEREVSRDISPIEENSGLSNIEDSVTSAEEQKDTEIDDPQSQIASFSKFDPEDDQLTSFKTKLELLSKFDVRIKVRTLKEGTIISSTTSDSESTTEERKFKATKDTKPNFEEKRQEYQAREDKKGTTINLRAVSSENIKMAVPNEADVKAKVDKFDVQVRITSEENLVVKEQMERSRRKDTLNLDVDDLSLRSMSEGDNSVFSEGGMTPVDPQAAGADDKMEEHSGNESEEVDDIELIFTTDESKDMSNLQEDLVSIRESGETDNWAPSSASTHSTPVLIKFHTLDPDFQPGKETCDNAENENQENSSLQGVIAESSLRIKRVSLPSDKDIRHVAFNGKSLDLPGRGILKSCDDKSDNMLYKRSPNTSTRRLDSVESLSCEYNRGLSFDNTKSSSFELGSSMDILHREESVDSFHRAGNFGHRFSVFAETDISKCGISEDDLASNLNMRRNTCPNPFQYRPAPTRYVSRPPGPFKAGAGSSLLTGRTRPVLRDPSGVRRESGAQTDVSALPPRWSSDGYLAYKMSAPAPTLPTRGVGGVGGAGGARRLTVPDARPPPRSDEARRVMLSDIGFTSMVPELSRSADPVWALAKRPSATDSSPVSTSTSKFLSRGSSYRSPCLSIDCSNDWLPQNAYAPARSRSRVGRGRAWRSSLPDVRGEPDDTDELLAEADTFLRRSIDNLRSTSLDLEPSAGQTGQPYIPAEPRHLRLGHTVKVITPHGRVAVGRVRYVGIAGGSAAYSNVVVGAEFPHAQNPGLPRNDGTHRGRRYFLAAPAHTALFLPFSKVVMAWAN